MVTKIKAVKPGDVVVHVGEPARHHFIRAARGFCFSCMNRCDVEEIAEWRGRMEVKCGTCGHQDVELMSKATSHLLERVEALERQLQSLVDSCTEVGVNRW